jgi:hypothetical protein
MTKRTRLFLWVAVGILVAGLGTGLVASYVGFQNLVIIGGDGPEELSYLPADVRFVAYATVRDVKDSEVRRKLTALQPGASGGADHFREQTGIDLETDVDYIVAAASEPTGTTESPGGPPLVLARGRFDPVRIETLIREQGGSVEDYNGSRLLVQDAMKLAVVFVEPGLAAIGTPSAVRRSIDTKAAGTDLRGNAEVMQLIRDIDDGDVWAVARFDAVPGGSLPADLASQLPPISWFSASGIIDSGLQGQVRAEARDEASAQNLQEVLRGFVALARLQAGQHAEIGELLNSLQLAAVGKTVSLSFSVPSEVIDALGALHAQRSGASQPAPAPAPSPDASAPPAL